MDSLADIAGLCTFPHGARAMVFSSIAFIYYFIPVVLVAYYISGCRNAVILAASIVFYAFGEGAYVAWLMAMVIVNHRIARRIEAASDSSARKLLWIGIAINCAVLVLFKYLGFIVANLSHVAGFFGLKSDFSVSIHLPIGISFVIFQLISYLVDVRRGLVQAEPSPFRLATYIMMFPHLLAGPIVRYSQILKDLHERHLTEKRVLLGVQYFVVGLAQKVLIANTAGEAVNFAFGMAPDSVSVATAWTGAVAYTLQIYFDFGGYSNMAIGLAFLLGYRFPKNFDYPYSARSITEFWRRWHMTLSFWFRDYVYIAMGGNRHGTAATLRNLVVVFFLTGLWHGANWTFVIWGMYHGCFLMAERAGLRRVLQRLPGVVQHLYTMLVVMVGWVLFRAADLHQAFVFLRAMAGMGGTAPFSSPLMRCLTPEVIAALVIGIPLSFPVVPRLLAAARCLMFNATSDLPDPRMDTMVVHRIPGLLLVLLFIASSALLVGGTLNPFLYYRF